LFPDIHRIHSVRAVSRPTGPSIPFIFQGVAGGKLRGDNFFAVATQSSQPHRILPPRHDFVEQAANCGQRNCGQR